MILHFFRNIIVIVNSRVWSDVLSNVMYLFYSRWLNRNNITEIHNLTFEGLQIVQEM